MTARGQALNIKKFAALCNLSVGTVSGIINKKPGFNADTVKFVHAKMREHQYQPNPYAQKMQHNRLQSISIICGTDDTYFKSYIIKELIKYVSRHGYNAYVHYLQDDATYDPLTTAVDAYIIMGCFPELLKKIEQYQLPAIILDTGGLKSSSIKQLYFDRSTAHQHIVDYFIKNGYRHFGFIGEANYTKYNEYEQALKQAGMSLDYYSKDTRAKNARRLFKTIKKSAQHVAFFIPFEGAVLQFVLQCELNGFEIGKDISAITWGMSYNDLLPKADFTRIGAFSDSTGAKILKHLQAKSSGREIPLRAEIHEGTSTLQLSR